MSDINQESQDVESTVEASVETTQTSQSWIDSLSDDLKSNPTISKFKDVESLAKSYVNAQKMIGSSVKIPGEGASEKEVADFYAKLGRPESFDKYELPELTTGETPEDLKDVLERMHKSNFTSAQVKEVLSIHNERHAKMMEFINKKSEADAEAVKNMWGQDFEKNTSIAKKAAELLIEKHGDSAKELFSSPLTNNPVLLGLLAELGNNLSEGNSKLISQKDIGVVDTEDSIRQEIQELRQSKDFLNTSSKGYKEAGERLKELYAKLVQVKTK